ncbi:hypothetical protein [Arthrobacter sp. A5]
MPTSSRPAQPVAVRQNRDVRQNDDGATTNRSAGPGPLGSPALQ